MKSSLKIVVPAPLDVGAAEKKKLELFGFTLHDNRPVSTDDLLNRLADAEILVATKINVDKALIDALPGLRYVIVPSVGFEWVDVAYARSKNITVMNCPTHNTRAVAEHAVMLALANKRRLLAANGGMKSGVWHSEDYEGSEIYSKRVAIIGAGRTGNLIGRMMQGFSAKVAYINSRFTTDDLEGVVRDSDIIFVCLSSNDSTKDLISKDFFSRMKDGTVLINTSRGAVVDQGALFDALSERKSLGAALDVFQGEPDYQRTVPVEIMGIVNLSNVTATPHIAYNTRESRERLVMELIEVAQSCLDARPINIVN